MWKLWRIKKKVMLPANHFPWLGLNYKEIYNELNSIGIGSIVQPNVEKQILNRKSYHNVIPESAVYYAVAVETENASYNFTKEYTDRTEYWRNQIGNLVLEMEHVLQRENIDLVVVIQGYEPHNAAARFAAIRMGISVLAIENTAHAQRMVWDNVSGITTNRNLAKNYYWKYHESVDIKKVLHFRDEYIENIKINKSMEHKTPTASKIVADGRPIVLFIGQVMTDSSVICGLGKWKSPLDVMEAVCVWCNKNGYHLVVKLHPKEISGKNTINLEPYRKLTFRKIQGSERLNDILYENKSIIDSENEFDTYDLIKKCEFAVTINSQAGLEALMFNRPVVVAGYSFYSGMGFTVDANDPNRFDFCLDEATTFNVPDSLHKFSYIFFEKYCVPKTNADLTKLIINNVTS